MNTIDALSLSLETAWMEWHTARGTAVEESCAERAEAVRAALGFECHKKGVEPPSVYWLPKAVIKIEKNQKSC